MELTYLNKARATDELDTQAQGIRDAMTNYKVPICRISIFVSSDINTGFHCNKILVTIAADSS